MEMIDLNEVKNDEIEVMDLGVGDVEDLAKNDLIDLSDIDEIDYEKTEHIYLDENNNIVDEENAVKRISRYYSANGKLIQEMVAYRTDEVLNEEFVTEFTDEQGNIVDEEVAYYAVYKRFVDGELVNEERLTIGKKGEKSL